MTLTATLSPSGATGTVTFYDGVSLLGIRPISGGQAVLTTILLPFGVRSLKAFYSGDATYQPGTSPALSQTVVALAENGFQPAVSYGGITFATFVAVADFNNDGNADLVLVDFTIDQVSVLLGNGDGTFRVAVNYGTGTGKAPRSVTVADFNGDGKADLAVGTGAAANSTVAVLLGNGDGTFKAAVNYAVGTGSFSIAAADFNGDGLADLVVANSTANNVSVLLGKGDGTFRQAVNYSTGLGPLGVVTGDFNGDGKPDVVTANLTAGTLSILIGNGDGTLKAPVNIAVGASPTFVAAGDFTGHGRTDLAVVNSQSDRLSVLLNTGDGTFKPAVFYDIPTGLRSVAVGDFNGDGLPDLVATDATSSSVSVLLGNGDGTFNPAVSYPAGAQAMTVAVGDFNGDGRSDLAVAEFVPGSLTVLLGKPVYSDLTIAKSHTGDFAQGQTGASYTITASNLGPGPTAGAVTVTDALPASLTATAIAGTGWNCTLAGLTCTRSDRLAAGGSYPPITLTVNVAPDAPVSVANTATVSGGGEFNLANDSTTDTANVTATLTIVTTALVPGSPGVAYDQTLAASGGNPPYTWALLSGDLPDGLALSESGEISGTPTTDGDSTFVVGVTDSAGASVSQAFTLTIADPSVNVRRAAIPKSPRTTVK